MKKQAKTLLIFTLLLIFFTCIPFKPLAVSAESSNSIKFESITTKEGLSQNCVTSVLQDSYGYLWIGTLVGLNKYDGISFQTYYKDENNPRSLSSSNIKKIYEDSHGLLWIGTDYGLNLFNRQNNTFTTYLNTIDNSNSISNNSILAIYEDSYRALWIGTENGLNLFNREKGTFTTYLPDSNSENSISGKVVKTIYEDNYGLLWIGTNNGLNLFNRNRQTFTSYQHSYNIPSSVSNNSIQVILEDRYGSLWIGTEYGLNLFDRDSKTFTVYLNSPGNSSSISNNSITNMCEDSQGTIWIGTNDGLNSFNRNENTFNNYKLDPYNPNSLNANRITALYSDNENNLWIGTINGLNKINFRKQVFNYYTGILLDNTISGIASLDKNTLLLETRTGIIQYNIENDEVENNWYDILTQQAKANLVKSMFSIGTDGSLWIGTDESGLLKFNSATGELLTFNSDNSELPSNRILSIRVDHKGIVWIGTTNGFCSFDTVTEEFNLYPDLVINGNVELIYETSDKRLWLVTQTALYILDNNGAKADILSVNEEAPIYIENIGKNTTYVMLEDASGLLWFGTNHGLFCYRLSENQFVSNTLAEAMTNETIITMLEDKSGVLWVATRQGLWRLSLEDNECFEYRIDDGLENDMFCSNAVYKAEDGELFFGTVGGLISFYPDKMIKNTTAPEVVINGFSLLEETISFDKPIEDIKEIKLSYSNNSIVIDFVALSYDSPNQIQYAYKLDGFDEDWNYCGANDSDTKYTNLRSGEYNFVVKAANSEGVWNNESTALKIVIATPFWEQWWFILSSVMLVISMIILFLQVRTRTLKKYAIILESNVEGRTQQLAQKSEQLQIKSDRLESELNNRAEFTRALVHELKTPMTSLQLTNDILSQQAKTQPFIELSNAISEDVNSLSNRVNEILDISRGEIGLLKLIRHEVSLEKFFVALKKELSLLVESEGKVLDFDIQDKLPQAFIDKERISQVIYNMVDNALKYTFRDGRILVSAKITGNNLSVEVKDNGRGISQDRLGNIFKRNERPVGDDSSYGGLGIGLSLSKMLIELHDGTIWVNSELNKGSTFGFSIPIKNTENQEIEN